MRINIKNMVCPRCVMTVREILTSLGYSTIDVSLGFAILDCDELSECEYDKLNERLKAVGFELLNNSDIELVEKVKIAVIRYARLDGGLKIKLSMALEQKLGQSYKTLTSTFSKNEGRTIENFYISQRIEYVKELISYGDLSLSDIAFKTGYSSVAYLSKQFSQMVGMTISEYRKIADDMREPLTEV